MVDIAAAPRQMAHLAHPLETVSLAKKFLYLLFDHVNVRETQCIFHLIISAVSATIPV